jgi:hypothetical protein
MLITKKYQITAGPGVCLLSFAKFLHGKLKPGIQLFSSDQVHIHKPKKFDYG